MKKKSAEHFMLLVCLQFGQIIHPVLVSPLSAEEGRYLSETFPQGLTSPFTKVYVQSLLFLARGKRGRPPPTESDLRYPLQQGRPNAVLYILPSYYNQLCEASDIKFSIIPFGRILTSYTHEHKHHSHTKDVPLS
jgi:hypothetical protein